jgi:hypothetical protein
VHIQALEPLFIDHMLDYLEQGHPMERGLRSSFRLALIELVQNFAEHSGSSAGAWVSGQFHPQAKRATICVLDLGKGIPNKLRTVRAYSRRRDATLIELSTREGVTSAPESRGKGLATIREIARVNRGKLTIIAGNARVLFRAHRRGAEKFELDRPFPGSAVFLSLELNSRGLFDLGDRADV